ncbi:arginine--tRNA ligase [Candidatus Woesearchaeota archaeon]|nr:MAG: arginine--tRNA ligase [Candidatus Woesearchaeota archaeon]
MEFVKNHIIEILGKLGVSKVDLEIPPSLDMGDYAFACFPLAKELKKAPNSIAEEFSKKISSDDIIERIECKGAYLNFYINRDYFFNNFSLDINKSQKQKILVEYPSPNTNKSLHVGHVRNMLLGNSLSRILKAAGNQVIKTNLNNDRGIAICKAMVTYKLFGDGKTPTSEGMKPDKFAENFYVLFGEKLKEDPNLDNLAQDMLLKWEQGDKETIELWELFLGWVFKGYEETYKNYNFSTDITYSESKIYDKGKDIVLEALDKNIEGFDKEDDGAVFVDLENKKLGKKFLLRGDGTTLYMTQDIYLAKLKEEKFNPDKLVFIVGSEQKYHFDVLFELLHRLGFGGVEKNYHFAYGYVYNKDGKKFSSRTGNTFGADELLEMVTEKSVQVLKEKHPELNDDEIEKRSRIIGYGALVFGFLKVNPLTDINFDIDSALSFEGETGPYIQYAYARIKSIFRKVGIEKIEPKSFSNISDKEYNIAKKISLFSDIVNDASLNFRPSSIARYLIELVQMFGSFYNDHKIIGEEKDIFEKRMYLIGLVAETIKQGLNLLDIEVVEEM